MKPILRLAILALIPTLILSSCGDDDESPTVPNPGPLTVSVVDNRFVPASITITAGDSITWRFEGSNRHTVTEGVSPSGSHLFDSVEMSSGTFGYRFNTAGTIPYFCRPHFDVDMKGTVTVQTP